MSGRFVPPTKKRTMRANGNPRMEKSRQMSLSRLAIAVLVSLALGLELSGCENVATYTQPSLVRFIDASYIAPAADVAVEGELLAANVGAGTITSYGTVPADSAALIEITAATGSTSLVTTNGTLLPGRQNSVFLTDNGAVPNGYEVTILEDQHVEAASGHSAFRFLNQAPKTAAVDIYMVPSGTTLADSDPLVADLAVGGAAGYTSFTSQTVTMVVTPTGKTTPQYTSTPITLVGGEVRTVLIMDTQLTSNPPVQATMADDAGPAD